MRKRTKIHCSVWHDSSTKGFRHGISHKRHDCWRGDIRQFNWIDGAWQQVSRIRKRFKCREEAKQWVANQSLNTTTA